MTLQPCYDFPNPNESILMSRTKVSVTAKGTVHEVDAEVRLELLPDARIEVHGSLPKSLGLFDLDHLQKLTIAVKDIPGFCSRMNIRSDGDGVEFVWGPQNEPVIGLGDHRTKIDSIFFHLFNYKEIVRGTRVTAEKEDNSTFMIAHVDLKASGWNVELKSLKTSPSTFKTLAETGGYGMTHVGCFRKEDGSSFDGKTAGEMLTVLRFFLSFSKGMWCNPCLAVGFDDKEKRGWEAWSSPQGHWAKPSSWFDPNHCDQLVSLFPGFLAKCENKDWQEALREVIYWYLSSNCSTLGRGIGIDAGIILTQAAIERLSFEYAVRYKRLIGAEGFKKLKAADKFRLLFSSLDIPIDIPASLPELQKLAKAKEVNWIDAPQAITEVRNTLVHPVNKRRGQFDGVFFPVWNLSQWYLELALLRICDYSGTYGNRLTQRFVGQVETVPWDNTKVK